MHSAELYKEASRCKSYSAQGPGAGNQAQEFSKGCSSQDQQPGLPEGQHSEGKYGAGGSGGPG